MNLPFRTPTWPVERHVALERALDTTCRAFRGMHARLVMSKFAFPGAFSIVRLHQAVNVRSADVRAALARH